MNGNLAQEADLVAFADGEMAQKWRDNGAKNASVFLRPPFSVKNQNLKYVRDPV
jgi:hypothetical protein